MMSLEIQDDRSRAESPLRRHSKKLLAGIAICLPFAVLIDAWANATTTARLENAGFNVVDEGSTATYQTAGNETYAILCDDKKLITVRLGKAAVSTDEVDISGGSFRFTQPMSSITDPRNTIRTGEETTRFYTVGNPACGAEVAVEDGPVKKEVTFGPRY